MNNRSNTPLTNSSSTSSGTKSTSQSQTFSSAHDLLQQRLWRAIDFLNITVMIFSMYTGIIIAVIQNELLEQCPLYSKLQLHTNAIQFLSESIDEHTEWGRAYTCDFALFTYLASFVVSFISLWIHFTFRRILRTERLLRLPIGLVIFIFAILSIISSSFVTDGIVYFCTKSPDYLCSSSTPRFFRHIQWKLISFPIGAWLTTFSLILNAFVRTVQLLSKPKKSPETLKILLNHLMIQKQQHRLDKEASDRNSQVSQISISQSPHRPSFDFSPNQNLYPIPQYRHIEKRSCFQRFCCPCLRRRRQRSKPLFHQSFPPQPYYIPDEYYHRLNQLQQTRTVPLNTSHRRPINQSIERQTQTTNDCDGDDNDDPSTFLGRRRSSVRFEDETKPEIIPVIKEEEQEEEPKPESPKLERNVSFRNNEDDLWTTITINSDQSQTIQSSHYNRINLENLTAINTSITNIDTGITAIQINSTSVESPTVKKNENDYSSPVSLQISTPPPPAPPLPPPLLRLSPSKAIRHRPSARHKLPPPPPSRCFTTSSEDDMIVRRIKPVETINTLINTTYNYNDVSQALKSNVQRLKSTFLAAQENRSIYDKPANLHSSNIEVHSSDC